MGMDQSQTPREWEAALERGCRVWLRGPWRGVTEAGAEVEVRAQVGPGARRAGTAVGTRWGREGGRRSRRQVSRPWRERSLQAWEVTG